MTRLSRCVLGVVLLLAAVPGFAGKIGFVDAERAVAQVDEGRRKLRELEEWAAPRRQQVDDLANRALGLKAQLESQQRVASPDALEKLAGEARAAQRAYEDARRSFERDLSARQDEFLGDVAVKVGTVASDYGKANDYDAIFVLKAQPLIYVAEPADLTDLVIRLYNERFPAGK